MKSEPLRVECYSGHSYAQEPRAFTWQGERRAVAVVERAWRTPAGPHFCVRTEDGARFELAYDEGADEWKLKAMSDLAHDACHLDEEVKNDA